MAQLEKIADGRYAVLGSLDFSSVTAVLAEVRALFNGQPLVLDFSRLEHANSAALALLLQLLGDARRARVELTFSNLPTSLQDLARVSNLQGLLGLPAESGD